MDIAHDRLGEHRTTTKDDKFEVFLSGQRHEEMTGVDDVLELDNSRKSRIQRLLITSSASTEGDSRPEHEIQVDFDGRSVGQSKITVSVRSDDAGWSDRALSEIEGLVERTWLTDVPHRVALAVGAILVAVFLLLLLLSSLGSWTLPIVTPMLCGCVFVTSTASSKILKQNRTITDEEMREIATKQLRNVLDGQRANKPTGWTRQKAFVGGPL